MSVTGIAGRALHLGKRLLSWNVAELPGEYLIKEYLTNEAGR